MVMMATRDVLLSNPDDLTEDQHRILEENLEVAHNCLNVFDAKGAAAELSPGKKEGRAVHSTLIGLGWSPIHFLHIFSSTYPLIGLFHRLKAL